MSETDCRRLENSDERRTLDAGLFPRRNCLCVPPSGRPGVAETIRAGQIILPLWRGQPSEDSCTRRHEAEMGPSRPPRPRARASPAPATRPVTGVLGQNDAALDRLLSLTPRLISQITSTGSGDPPEGRGCILPGCSRSGHRVDTSGPTGLGRSARKRIKRVVCMWVSCSAVHFVPNIT